MAMTIDMLPAERGDSLLVSWGPKTARRRMLIDGGPLNTYQGVHDAVAALGTKATLELLVITHIDGDHIEGAIRLLQDRAALGLSIKDTWFNGWPQLPTTDLQGPDFGEMVGALLLRDKLPWNKAARGKAIQRPDTGKLPVFSLPGKAKLTIIAPGTDELRDLRAQWTKVLLAAGVTPGKPEEALARLAKRATLRGLEAADMQGGTEPPLDNSVANGSSISFLFEADGAAVLFTGDGHGPVLVEGLKRLLAERGLNRLPLDAVKLPHHCSKANVTADFLALLDTPRFLISTNGAKYKHPDKQAVDRILKQPKPHQPIELIFNYNSTTTAPWLKEKSQQKLGYTASFPGDTTSGVQVTL